MKNQHAFSLLECMAALAIVSIMLTVLLMLQARYLRIDHQSYLNNIAGLQLQSMAERIYANPGTVSFAAEVSYWNEYNEKLLPQGRGECLCGKLQCDITLQWFDSHWRHMQMMVLR